MYGDVMVRKQLYIDEAHEAALKEQAARTGLTEAEIVRRALDAHLADVPGHAGAQRGRARAVAAMDELAESIVNDRDYVTDESVREGRGWTRTELYDERESRVAGR